MKQRKETITTVQLDHEQLMVFDGGPGGRVRVLYGAAWLTAESEAADMILAAGNEARLHEGRTLIEALASTQLQVSGPVGYRPAGRRAPGVPRPAAWWRRALRAARRQITRLQLGPTAA